MVIRRKNAAAAAGFMAICLGSTALTPAWAHAAPVAEQNVRDYSIAAQSLQSALLEFSKQSESPVVAPVSLTLGRQAPAVAGRMAEADALNGLLAGSGLLAMRGPDGGWAIRSASDPQSESAAGDGADSGTVQALIVTAQKREEDIQDVPIAISAFTQEDLTRSQVAGGPDLMTQVPNMTFTKTNFTSYSIQIRGIGTQAISATVDPAVAVAFNNTPFIRNHFFEQEFYDLERVEVLRGPQGTLYGRNATAGVVNVISAKPKFHFAAKFSADVANYDSTRFEGMVNLPLVDDKAALRIAGAWTKRQGFVKNILTGEQTDGRDLWSARVSLALAPTDNFRADLIYEHFEENDDRLRSGKQLCMKDPGPTEVGGKTLMQSAYPLIVGANYFSLGCKPTSMYSPEAFQTPNGYALAYYGPAGALGSPVFTDLDPYASSVQSRDLREIETHIKPEYLAHADLTELQLRYDLSPQLTLTSETAFSRDFIFSWQDFNRFDTTPNVFAVEGGVFCDPQVGCSSRLAAADLATASSQQFSQEFRLSSNYEGPFNFSLGANYLRYDTEDKYYVFINSLTAWGSGYSSNDAPGWIPGVSDNAYRCLQGRGTFQPNEGVKGYAWSDPNRAYGVGGCFYIDPNDIHNLNDEGRNYFLSKNPYHLNSYAAFGEAYYQISPALKLTAGVRWTVDKKTAPQIPSWLIATESWGLPVRKVIEQEWREPTGRLAIDWKPDLDFTDETLLYASYVRGYKAGGANPPPPVVVTYGSYNLNALLNASLTHPETFAPEFVNAFEVGSKNTLMEGRLTFNLGGFYYDYTGYQISQIVDRSAVNLNFDAKVWGAEIEADWRPLENLRFGFKGGYENTRMADGSKAIDFMDRTAGDPNWTVFKPFPPIPSNCVIPVWFAERVASTYASWICESYLIGIDPLTRLPYVPNPQFGWDGTNLVPLAEFPNGGADVTNYPGFDPTWANHGEGFFKDLSGNKLPNAPKFTATITADFTAPLPADWLMTLHTDLYYQSEAWTRVFNTPGYDKLKAYTNVNLAAIFTNEDAGWMVMAYVKNVMDRDSITGAFLNSDDTGLTTNVFLTEPRLYGLRVTKNWNGSDWWSSHAHRGGDWYPFTVELEGYYGRFGHDHDYMTTPYSLLYPADFAFPFGTQKDLDWGGGGRVKFVYAPSEHGWNFSVAVRYGAARGDGAANKTKNIAPYCGALFGNTFCIDPSTGKSELNGQLKYTNAGTFNFSDTTTKSEEGHAIADFMVGHDVGFGLPGGARSNFSGGVEIVRFNSMTRAEMHGRPDLAWPEENIFSEPAVQHRFTADLRANREFVGAGPALSWDASAPLMGSSPEKGQVSVDVGLGGAVLFGRQRMQVEGKVQGDHRAGILIPDKYDVTPAYEHPVSLRRSRSATVPAVSANLGLSYALGGLKVGGGYRTERYFNAVDGGYLERKTYDRSFDGPYFKVSVGFGG